MERPRVALVFGARTSGRAVVAERLAAGWRALAVARSAETLERLRADHPVEAAIARAVDELGGLDLVVNAVGGGARGGPFGGGPLTEAPADRLDGWTGGFLPPAFHIMRLGGRALAERGAGTIIQLAGGSARRGMPGRGPWAA